MRKHNPRRSLLLSCISFKPRGAGINLTPGERDKLMVAVAAMAARGRRLDIPAGTAAVRFEPGQMREVRQVAFAGGRVVYGFGQKVMGSI
jgi:hypothetical protein